jgi:hypothetical protein
MEHFGIFHGHSVLQLFGMCYGHLVHFWRLCIFTILVPIVYQGKSGNPAFVRAIYLDVFLYFVETE